jgi:acetyltransferase-like isoleucine patch superfamily enzyme
MADPLDPRKVVFRRTSTNSSTSRTYAPDATARRRLSVSRSVSLAAKAIIKHVLARTLDRYIERRIVRGHTIFGDRSRVTIHPTARVYGGHFNTSSGTITIQQHAFFGPNVTLVTGTHDHTRFGLARNYSVPTKGRDIVIEEGVWIAASATVLGPCRVGRHSVVSAGAVVTRDVPPFTVVAGVPARPVRHLNHPSDLEEYSKGPSIPEAGTSTP